MRVKTIVIALILLLINIQGVKAQEYSNKYVPADGKTLVSIGGDINTLDEYVSVVGPTPAGFTQYTSINNMDGLYSSADYGAGPHDAQYIIDKYPNTVMDMGLYMVDQLDQTIAGDYDANIDKLGQWAKNTNRPIYLRIGYEFDGPHNHYDPNKYKLAYRHIADRLRANGVDNISYVWHSWGLYPYDAIPVMDWYPGDEYVDWMGISYFTQRDTVFGTTYMDAIVALAQAHNKPVMIPESAPAQNGIDKHGDAAWDIWFKEFFKYIEDNDIKSFTYFNYNWDDLPLYYGWEWGNSRVQDNEYVKQMWIQELRKAGYLHSSDTLFAELGYNAVPEPSTMIMFALGILGCLRGIQNNDRR